MRLGKSVLSEAPDLSDNRRRELGAVTAYTRGTVDINTGRKQNFRLEVTIGDIFL